MEGRVCGFGFVFGFGVVDCARVGEHTIVSCHIAGMVYLILILVLACLLL